MNLAARLCGVARAAEVLVPERVIWAVPGLIDAELVGDFELKGFTRRVRAYNVLRMKA